MKERNLKEFQIMRSGEEHGIYKKTIENINTSDVQNAYLAGLTYTIAQHI